MKKPMVIEDFGRIDERPMYDPEISHYTLQLMKYKNLTFYRRQKVRLGKVSSSSYSIDKNKWTAGINKFLNQNIEK